MTFIGEDEDPDLMLLAETVTINSGEALMSNRDDDSDSKAEKIVWLDAEAIVNGTDTRKTVRVVFGRELAKRCGILFIQAIGKEPEDGSE